MAFAGRSPCHGSDAVTCLSAVGNYALRDPEVEVAKPQPCQVSPTRQVRRALLRLSRPPGYRLDGSEAGAPHLTDVASTQFALDELVSE